MLKRGNRINATLPGCNYLASLRRLFALKVQNQAGIYIVRDLRCSRVPVERTGGPTMSLDFGSLWGDDEPKRKSVSKFLRKAVWDRDGGKCQLCGKPADSFNFDLAHNRAHARGGKLTLANTYVAHPSCNRSIGTLTKKSALRQVGIETPEDRVRRKLNGMSLPKLKDLAKQKGVKVKGRVEENWLWGDQRKPPTKRQFVSKLIKILKEDDL